MRRGLELMERKRIRLLPYVLTFEHSPSLNNGTNSSLRFDHLSSLNIGANSRGKVFFKL